MTEMQMEIIEARFPRGTCPIVHFGASAGGAGSVVILFMDAFGPRPALNSIALRLAAEGYHVLLPHLFYDHLPFTPFDPLATFGNPTERDRLMGYFASVTHPSINADVDALLALLEMRFGVDVKVGCVGYCMGGRYALTAAVSSRKVAYAASFHGSNLAPDRFDSVHHRLAATNAHIYIGIAENDPTFGKVEQERLAAALRDAGTDHRLETFSGAAHGFAMADLPVYHDGAFRQHWERIKSGLAEHI